MKNITKPKPLVIIPRTPNLRSLSPDVPKYSTPKPVNYRSPTPYARIVNLGWGKQKNVKSPSSD